MDVIRIDSKNTKMVAHRGLSGLERENTCPAFVAAGNRSYYGVETDVHVTKDGQFVIIHDETTERVSGGVHNFNVEECAYAELKDLTLPDMDGSCTWKLSAVHLTQLYRRVSRSRCKFSKTQGRAKKKSRFRLLHACSIGAASGHNRAERNINI